MQESKKILEQLISLMGFKDFSITQSDTVKRLSVYIVDAPFLSEHLPQMVENLNFIFKSALKKRGLDRVFIDINNYKKDREDIIIKLAKAAAKKCETTRESVFLPAMNSFERLIIHNELSKHPSVNTYSEGEGKDRHIIISPLD